MACARSALTERGEASSTQAVTNASIARLPLGGSGEVVQIEEESTGIHERLNGAVGLKINPFGRLLLDANLLFALDDHGVRDRVTPLIGFEYSF